MKIDVLNSGYVRYDKHMGDDLDVINSAKVSFDRASESFTEREAKLLAFLIRDEHTSTFRHSAITLEVYAPLLVARQWFKYAVASTHLEDQFGWNESSRRYITESVEFYLPTANEWREAPDNKKQGSGNFFEQDLGSTFTKVLSEYQAHGEYLYKIMLNDGVAPEQARLFLPAYGLMVRWRWTASLGAVLHFLHQRLAHDAQSEIREYAGAVKEIVAVHFPHAVQATLENI